MRVGDTVICVDALGKEDQLDPGWRYVVIEVRPINEVVVDYAGKRPKWRPHLKPIGHGASRFVVYESGPELLAVLAAHFEQPRRIMATWPDVLA